MFFAISAQQVGLLYTSAGKAAFITCLYIVLVPLFEVFLHRAISKYTWLGTLLASCGLYMLCVKEGFSVSYGDAILFGSTFLWAFHILYVDHCVQNIDSLTFAFMQFLACAVMSLAVAVCTEKINWAAIFAERVPLLYGGIFPVGVAYTLQIVGQKYAKPSHAAIILSLESVFGALSGYLFLNEMMTAAEFFGCVLMAFGVIAAQLDGILQKKEQMN
jgi:drug/metabolite transporter (DMT)-like permease